MPKKSKAKEPKDADPEMGTISTVRTLVWVIEEIHQAAKVQNRSKANMVSVILQAWAKKQIEGGL